MKERWRKEHKGQRLKVTFFSDPLGKSLAFGQRILFNGEDQHCWFAALTDHCIC